MKKIKMILMTAAMAFQAVMTSCDYKDLDEGGYSDMHTFTIDFDWTKTDSIPEAMRVVFYPADEQAKNNMTKGYTIFDLPQSFWPAEVQLPAGIYDVTAWNNDTEHVITDKYGKQQSVNATTPTYNARGTFDTPSVLDSLYDGQRVLDYPDYMVHANKVDLDVSHKDDNRLMLTPDSMVVTIDYYVRGIGGLSWVKQIRGAVNNVAGKRYMAYDNLTEKAVAVMFDCQYSAEDSLVYGRFYVYGIEPTESIQALAHKMTLFFWMEGGKVFLPIDVTGIFARIRKDQKKMLIDIPPLDIDLRDYISSENTFDVNLDEWENINIDIGF